MYISYYGYTLILMSTIPQQLFNVSMVSNNMTQIESLVQCFADYLYYENNMNNELIKNILCSLSMLSLSILSRDNILNIFFNKLQEFGFSCVVHHVLENDSAFFIKRNNNTKNIFNNRIIPIAEFTKNSNYSYSLLVSPSDISVGLDHNKLLDKKIIAYDFDNVLKISKNYNDLIREIKAMKIFYEVYCDVVTEHENMPINFQHSNTDKYLKAVRYINKYN